MLCSGEYGKRDDRAMGGRRRKLAPQDRLDVYEIVILDVEERVARAPYSHSGPAGGAAGPAGPAGGNSAPAEGGHSGKSGHFRPSGQASLSTAAVLAVLIRGSRYVSIAATRS